jgi:flagellar biogenesis protein FliO
MALQESNMQTFNWAQFFASSVGIFVILFGALWWVRRQKNLTGTVTNERRIQMIEALPLSLKHKMVLLQIDDQMILASVSPAEVKTLHAWRSGDDHAQ